MTSLRKRLRGGLRSRVNAINVNSRKTLFMSRDNGERDFYGYINVPYSVNNNNIIYKNRKQTTSNAPLLQWLAPQQQSMNVILGYNNNIISKGLNSERYTTKYNNIIMFIYIQYVICMYNVYSVIGKILLNFSRLKSFISNSRKKNVSSYIQSLSTELCR